MKEANKQMDTPFGRVTKEGLTPMPREWTRRVDQDYLDFLSGKKSYRIRCHFTDANGNEFHEPCKLVSGQIIPTVVRTKGFGF